MRTTQKNDKNKRSMKKINGIPVRPTNQSTDPGPTVCVMEILKISESSRPGGWTVYPKVHITKVVWSLALTSEISRPA